MVDILRKHDDNVEWTVNRMSVDSRRSNTDFINTTKGLADINDKDQATSLLGESKAPISTNAIRGSSPEYTGGEPRRSAGNVSRAKFVPQVPSMNRFSSAAKLKSKHARGASFDISEDVSSESDE